MRRSSTNHCRTCATLYDLNETYSPQTRTYDETRPGGWRRTTKHQYDGIDRLGSPSLQTMKRLYVRENEVNRPIEFITATSSSTRNQCRPLTCSPRPFSTK